MEWRSNCVMAKESYRQIKANRPGARTSQANDDSHQRGGQITIDDLEGPRSWSIRSTRETSIIGAVARCTAPARKAPALAWAVGSMPFQCQQCPSWKVKVACRHWSKRRLCRPKSAFYYSSAVGFDALMKTICSVKLIVSAPGGQCLSLISAIPAASSSSLKCEDVDQNRFSTISSHHSAPNVAG